MSDPKSTLNADDILYVADMLRAIVWIREELPIASAESLECLEKSLSTAEASLRRVAAEIDVPAEQG